MSSFSALPTQTLAISNATTPSPTFNCSPNAFNTSAPTPIGVDNNYCIKPGGHYRMPTCCSQHGGNGTVFVHDECYAWCEFGPDSSLVEVSDSFNDCLMQGSNDSASSILKDADYVSVAVGPFSCGVGGSRQSGNDSDSDGGSNADDDEEDNGGAPDETGSGESGGVLAYGAPSWKATVGALGLGALVLSGLFV